MKISLCYLQVSVPPFSPSDTTETTHNNKNDEMREFSNMIDELGLKRYKSYFGPGGNEAGFLHAGRDTGKTNCVTVILDWTIYVNDCDGHVTLSACRCRTKSQSNFSPCFTKAKKLMVNFYSDPAKGQLHFGAKRWCSVRHFPAHSGL